MAAPPRSRGLSREAFPGLPAALDPLLTVLNEFMASTSAALSRRLSRLENFYAGEKTGIAFKSPAAGVATVTVKWEAVGRPRHVVPSGLARRDGAEISAAWSCTWRLTDQGQIAITFQGLAASTDYVCGILYE